MLVAFAWIDGIPNAIKAGNVIIVPPPATEFIAPAAQAAANKTSISIGVGTREASAMRRLRKSRKIKRPMHRIVRPPFRRLAIPARSGHGRAMRSRVAKSFWNKVGEQPFGVLLAALALMMMLSPCIPFLGSLWPSLSGMALLSPLSLIVIGASTLTLWQRSRHHAWQMIATCLVVGMLMLGSVITHKTFLAAQLVIQIIFLGNVIRVVVRSVFKTRNVTSDVLCGAICIYLLTGVLAGLVFVLIESLAPGSFHLMSADETTVRSQDALLKDPGWLMYFSFVTLTTVGYGDIVPNSGIARSAAVLVAVTGQVLLVIQIARLVGMHVAQTAPSRGDQGD